MICWKSYFILKKDNNFWYLEYIEDRDIETEKWLEKKTGKMLIVPIEIIRHFDMAESY